MDPGSAIAIFALLLRDISYKYNECVSFLTGDISLSGPSLGMCNISFVIDLVFTLRFLAAFKSKFIIFMVSHPAKIENCHWLIQDMLLWTDFILSNDTSASLSYKTWAQLKLFCLSCLLWTAQNQTKFHLFNVLLHLQPRLALPHLLLPLILFCDLSWQQGNLGWFELQEWSGLPGVEGRAAASAWSCSSPSLPSLGLLHCHPNTLLDTLGSSLPCHCPG